LASNPPPRAQSGSRPAQPSEPIAVDGGKPRRKAATAQIAVVVVVLMLVLASATMAIYYFKH
jgi:hypothetical protein